VFGEKMTVSQEGMMRQILIESRRWLSAGVVRLNDIPDSLNAVELKTFLLEQGPKIVTDIRVNSPEKLFPILAHIVAIRGEKQHQLCIRSAI
jgi:hypothetical protein